MKILLTLLAHLIAIASSSSIIALDLQNVDYYIGSHPYLMLITLFDNEIEDERYPALVE